MLPGFPDRNRTNASASVVIIQRVISLYRVPFFLKLQKRLDEMGIRLIVIFGQEHPGIRSQAVHIEESWARKIINRYLSPLGYEVVWQPCFRSALQADLVIVEQAGRLLINYPLHLLSFLKFTRLAFWGHGQNWQAVRRSSLLELLKGWISGKADWWFAYTEKTEELLLSRGFAEDRITVVRNTVDTEELANGVREVSEEELARCRESLGICGDNVVLYCGGMYPNKRLDFLLDTCRKLQASLSDFVIICIGSGSDQHLIEEAERFHTWVRYVGPVTGRARAVYFKMAKALLIPASVGLGIVDSFAAGVPLVTTDLAGHGPEIAYLRSGDNGIVTRHDTGEYTAAVLDLLMSPARQQALAAACRECAADFGIDGMVDRFATGICTCLGFCK